MVWEQYLKARQQVENPPLDSVNPHFGNKFASLAATLAVIRKATQANGIDYQQKVAVEDGNSYIVTFVFDDKGSVIPLSKMPIPTRDNPQQAGSDLTYRKRQVAQLDWCICGEIDDDGEAAVKRDELADMWQKCIDMGIPKTKMNSWYKSKGYGSKKLSELDSVDRVNVREYLLDLMAKEER